jgi:CPA2 family monovalent cation:H+ antiporter-2
MVHLPHLISDLATILAVAGIMSFIFQKIKQPVVLGYILAGIIVGPFTPPAKLVTDIPSIKTWAELGVIFLMFTLGLEFSFRKLMSVGLTACLAAGFEVVFFLFTGYGIGKLLQWSNMDALFLGAMLSISSTTIIIKALDELKLKRHRFAGLIFGTLIVEDLLAILLIVGLTTVAETESVSLVVLVKTGLNLLLVVGSWFIAGYLLVPRLMTYIGRKGNNEMLTLISIGLCLLLVVLASKLGYSAALGAFIMGSILAETEIIHRIENLMAPLRDLFGAIFFVSIGMLIDPTLVWKYKEVIVVLCFVTIFGKIFSTSLGALVSGQPLKSSLQVGMGLAQIGEFSFIIASLGLALGAISEKLYPIAVAVSLVTTFTTPYLIKYSGMIAEKFEERLPLRFRERLASYNRWSEYRKTTTGQNKDIVILIGRWLINGIIVSIIFRVCLKHLGPKIQLAQPGLAEFLTWVVSFAISLPFIWGMLFTSKENYIRIRKEGHHIKAIVIFSFPVLTAIWIGVLSSGYFPLRFIALVIVLVIIIIYFILYKRLESSYRWFEATFLETFQNRGESSRQDMLRGLAPWDSHLSRIEVHPNAKLANTTLREAHLRSRFGVMVVAIQRGLSTMVSPMADELISPNDTLIVLGNDDQLDQVRPHLEIPFQVLDEIPRHSDYRLRHVKLSEASPFIGTSLRDSGLREKFQVMVVGLERGESRTVNPQIDSILQINDILWVVGEVGSLDEFVKNA